MACTPMQYTGSECMSELLQIQRCLPDASATDISISSDVDIGASTMALGTIRIGFGQLMASDECVEAALPLLCLFYFSLCDTSTEVSYLPSSSQCMEVRDGPCRREWAAANMALPGILPVCEDLPDTTVVCPGKLNSKHGIERTQRREGKEEEEKELRLIS